jgi:YggT family protein
MLIISVLSGQRFGSTFHVLMNRAFTPFQKALRRFGLHGQHFYLSVFVSLLILYALISVLITGILIPKTPVASASLIRGFGEGLRLVLELFPFPGFFSLIIIVGALLSWVSPDPSNPVVQTIYGISEPLLMPFRRFIPLVGGLDLSPIAALFCFQILGGIGLDLVGSLMK